MERRPAPRAFNCVRCRSGDGSTDEQVEFWLRGCRTPALLIELVAAHLAQARASRRPVVRAAVAGDGEAEIERLLDQGLLHERVADRA